MTRVLLAVAGVAVAAYGVLLLLADAGELVGVGAWLVSGVLVHDLVIAPIAVLLVLAAGRLLPGAWHAPAAVALVVVGSLTLLAVPVLGRFGARADNPTLLDRPYLAGWAGIVGLTLLATAAVALARARRATHRTTGSGRGTGSRG
jgi:hypothetical protein